MGLEEKTNLVDAGGRENRERLNDSGVVLLLSFAGAYLIADLTGWESYALTLPFSCYLGHVVGRM